MTIEKEQATKRLYQCSVCRKVYRYPKACKNHWEREHRPEVRYG